MLKDSNLEREDILFLAMPVHYSTDLRWRTVWLNVLRRMSYSEISDPLFLSELSVMQEVC